ncbi:J domain-containing protein, partial [Acinetobacter soli]|uniref:J domain-containing protein n=1 Tax=Acinetobacter soli TaxID=487316 RepID=UPI0012DDED19
MINYYTYLKISESASYDEIKLAYRKLAQKIHPDRYKGNDAEEKMKLLNEIKATLLDHLKRAEYDRQLVSFKQFQEKIRKEAQQRAEKEAQQRAEKEAQQRAEKEAQQRAEKEAQQRAEKEAQQRAEKEAQQRAEKEA